MCDGAEGDVCWFRNIPVLRMRSSLAMATGASLRAWIKLRDQRTPRRGDRIPPPPLRPKRAVGTGTSTNMAQTPIICGIYIGGLSRERERFTLRANRGPSMVVRSNGSRSGETKPVKLEVRIPQTLRGEATQRQDQHVHSTKTATVPHS
jgi:hypothetical protein